MITFKIKSVEVVDVQQNSYSSKAVSPNRVR